MNMNNSRINNSTLRAGEMKSNRSGASPFAGQHKNSMLTAETPSKIELRPQTGKPKAPGAPGVSVFDFKGDILTKL